jgi:hypothetical protein
MNNSYQMPPIRDVMNAIKTESNTNTELQQTSKS